MDTADLGGPHDDLESLATKADHMQMQSVIRDLVNGPGGTEPTSASAIKARATKLLQEKLDADRLAAFIEKEKSVMDLQQVLLAAAQREGDPFSNMLASFDKFAQEKAEKAAKRQAGIAERKAAAEAARKEGKVEKKEEKKNLVEPRVIELRHVEFTQVSYIKDLEERFAAEVFMQLAFPGGAKDKDLWNDSGVDFPIGPNGMPTFKPTAKWYFEKLEFCNSIGTVELVDQMIYTAGDDVCTVMGWSAEFYERFETAAFPFDVQSLSVQLKCNVRTTGKTPVKFAVSPTINKRKEQASTVIAESFKPSRRWRLLPKPRLADDSKDGRQKGDKASGPPGHLHAEEGDFGEGDRLRPAVLITATVQRRPGLYVVNMMLPMFVFALLTFSQWTLPVSEVADRMSITLTLLLTGASTKLTVAGMTPDSSYLTLLDKYVMGCLIVIFAAAFETGVMGYVLSLIPSPSAEQLELFDKVETISLFSIFAAFVLMNLYFLLPMSFPQLSRHNHGNLVKGGFKKRPDKFTVVIDRPSFKDRALREREANHSNLVKGGFKKGKDDDIRGLVEKKIRKSTVATPRRSSFTRVQAAQSAQALSRKGSLVEVPGAPIRIGPNAGA